MATPRPEARVVCGKRASPKQLPRPRPEARLEPQIFAMVGWLIMLVMVLGGCELVVKDQLRRNLILIYPRLGKPNY